MGEKKTSLGSEKKVVGGKAKRLRTGCREPKKYPE